MTSDKLVSSSVDGSVCVCSSKMLHIVCLYRYFSANAGAISSVYMTFFAATMNCGIHLRGIILTVRSLLHKNHGLSLMDTADLDFLRHINITNGVCDDGMMVPLTTL